ncbi:C-X-C chemokine receptor type 6, partial [Dissostichus eleginoides]
LPLSRGAQQLVYQQVCSMEQPNFSVVTFNICRTSMMTDLVAITRSGPNTHLVCQQVCNMEQLNLTFNISSPPGEPSNASWVFYLLVPVVVLFISFLLGVPGNIAVIILKPNWQHLSSLSQSLMLNLAISDLICLLSLPLWIYTLLYSWTLGLVACKILTYIMYCGVYSSMLTVTVLSVQRYLQVVNMQKIFECEGKRRLLVLLWLVTMILSIPALVVPQDTKDQYGTSCTHIDSLPSQLVAMLLTECLEGLVAISVVAFSYIGLHSKLNHAAFFNNPQTTRLIIIISSLQEYSGPVEATLHPSSWDHKKQLHEYYIALDGELLPCKAKSSLISSTPDHPSTASWVSIRLVPALVVSICFLLGVPGNIAVIILKPNWQHLSSLSQSLMLNLAISDLICLLPLPLWIYTLLYSWTLGLVACKLLTYLMLCCLYSSLLSVTLLSVQRYLQVVNLQKMFDRVGKMRLLVLHWLVTMILCFPALVIRQVIKDQHGTSCTGIRSPFPAGGRAAARVPHRICFNFCWLFIHWCPEKSEPGSFLQQPTDDPAHHKYHCDLFLSYGCHITSQTYLVWQLFCSKMTAYGSFA